MDKNNIKKELYKQKPIAHLDFIRKGILYYYTILNNTQIRFEIPINDIGDADFTPEMDAKLLNRYIVN